MFNGLGGDAYGGAAADGGRQNRALQSDPYRYRGAPVKLHWAGWETDTLRLQSAGWTIAAEQDPHYDRMRLAIAHHRHDVRGLTPLMDFKYTMALRDPDHVRQLPPYPISLAHKLWIREHAVNQVSVSQWKLIDANPSIDMFNSVSIDDICHFKPQAVDDLVVPEETVPELLQRIVDMQSGARLERFREQVREERASRKLIVPHCQIISLRDAA